MQKIIFLILFLISIKNLIANSEYDIYEFLKTMNAKGIINYNIIIQPISKLEIAEKLIEIENKREKLNKIEKYQLQRYLSEYEFEINALLGRDLPKISVVKDQDGFVLFKSFDKNFSLIVNPIIQISYGSNFGEKIFIRRNGLQFKGIVSNNIEYYLNFYDNYEKSKFLDNDKFLSFEPSYRITRSGKNFIEYEDLKASLTYKWTKGNITLGMDKFNIGSGNSGKLILSDKSPSFPFIRFDYYPVNWLRFTYFHGFLKSNIPDSTTFRYNRLSSRTSMLDIPKFYVFHLISLYPFENLNFSVGESVVYSERLQLGYFIPIIFFRSLDHYLDIGNSSAGNAQMFIDISYTNYNFKSKLYSTVFVDEISLSSLLRGGNHKAIGYTVGLETRDIFLPLSKLFFEYTLINPFVYMNSVDAQVYSNQSIKMGHWIESNGQIISSGFNAYLLKDFSISTNFWYYLKGKTEQPAEQYQKPYPKTLYGARRTEKGFNIKMMYKPIYPVTLNFTYQFTDIKDEEIGRTKEFKLGKKNSFLLSLGFML